MPDRHSNIFLIDDHPLVRLWLAQLIEEQSDLVVCGEADNVRDAVSRIAATRPDLVIVDISLPGASGIELIKILKSQYPHLLMIVLSMHDESVYAERAVRAGARGFVMKRERRIRSSRRSTKFSVVSWQSATQLPRLLPTSLVTVVLWPWDQRWNT